MAKNDVNDTFTRKFADAKFSKDELFIVDNLMYEVIGGSHAYGVQNDDSDYDIVSIFMNKHSDLYPQQYGYIMGYDTETGRFDNKECKGVGNRLIHKGKEVEAEWRSLTRFANLAAMQGSPNLVEILFVRKQNITFVHPAFVPIIDNAHKFISMKTFHAFKGYTHSQYHKMVNHVKTGKSDNSTRQEYMDVYGYDVKKAYHILRLLDIISQMLEGETQIDLMHNKEECKAMRRGEWGTWDDFSNFVNEKMLYIEKKSDECTLPYRPRSEEIRNILNNSIETWYGTNEGSMIKQREYISAEDIKAQLDRIELSVKNIVQ